MSYKPSDHCSTHVGTKLNWVTGECTDCTKPKRTADPAHQQPYRFCSSCGVRVEYENPTCLYPNRHGQ